MSKQQDELTTFSIFEEFGRQKTTLLTGAVLALGLAGTVQAEGPAVDGFNGKLEVDGGTVGGDGAGFIAGSVTAPLGERFGLQLDGAVGEVDNNDANGLAAHLFYRDPERYMVGLTATTVRYRSQDVDRLGIEGELYRDQWTVGAALGEQSGDLGTDAYYGLDLKYYPNQDFALNASIDGYDNDQMLSLGAEWQAKPGWSVLVAGGTGDGDDYVMVGVRLYLGKNKTLMGRHRQDDPENPLLPMVNSLKKSMDKQAVIDAEGTSTGPGGDWLEAGASGS
ncbi:MAG: hypothetical protein ABW168_27850 [Sedimenticola sp.]